MAVVFEELGRVQRIYGGANEIMKEIIARSLLGVIDAIETLRKDGVI
jgi:hypothetical protein